MMRMLSSSHSLLFSWEPFLAIMITLRSTMVSVITHHFFGTGLFVTMMSPIMTIFHTEINYGSTFKHLDMAIMVVFKLPM